VSSAEGRGLGSALGYSLERYRRKGGKLMSCSSHLKRTWLETECPRLETFERSL
jgi:hypothetical protein